ncbi:LysR family transcriptional regulator [Maritalea sp.]|uniref:LysR family transcriptional regulator n=1 Tax=Maritalea sp. TaxID=2003361 RepID=UPI003EF48F5B
MDKIRALEYFMKVAETGSFSAAAALFGVPPSSISRRIQDLEASLGVNLLHRTTRSVRLTEIGSIYLDQIRPAVGAIAYADQIVGNQSEEPSGLLRITTSPSYGRLHLLPALDKLRRLYPKLIVDIELTDKVANLATNDVDIAVRATTTPPERAVARKLCDDNYQIVAAPSYLTRKGTPKSISEIENHDALIYRNANAPVNWHAKLEDGWVDVRTRAAYLCSDGGELLRACLDGGGLALLPEWSLAPYKKSGQLKVVEFENTKVSVFRTENAAVYLLYHRPKYRLNKIKVTVDYLVAALSTSS